MYSAWAEPESTSIAPRSDENIRKHVFTGHLHQDQVPPLIPRLTRPSSRQRPGSRLSFPGAGRGSPGFRARPLGTEIEQRRAYNRIHRHLTRGIILRPSYGDQTTENVHVLPAESPFTPSEARLE